MNGSDPHPSRASRIDLTRPPLIAANAAELLGIPRSSVYDYARREHDPLPSAQIGQHILFVLLELVDWVDRQRRREKPPTPSWRWAIMTLMETRPAPLSDSARTTWNAPERIAAHRALSPKERLRLTIEASRAALRFAHGPRRGGR